MNNFKESLRRSKEEPKKIVRFLDYNGFVKSFGAPKYVGAWRSSFRFGKLSEYRESEGFNGDKFEGSYSFTRNGNLISTFHQLNDALISSWSCYDGGFPWDQFKESDYLQKQPFAIVCNREKISTLVFALHKKLCESKLPVSETLHDMKVIYYDSKKSPEEDERSEKFLREMHFRKPIKGKNAKEEEINYQSEKEYRFGARISFRKDILKKDREGESIYVIEDLLIPQIFTIESNYLARPKAKNEHPFIDNVYINEDIINCLCLEKIKIDIRGFNPDMLIEEETCPCF